MKEYRLSVNGRDYVIALKSISGDRAEMEVNGEGYVVDIHSIHRTGSPKRRPSPAPHRQNDEDGPHVPAAPKMVQASSESGVCAPIPGVVMEVYVKVGESVAAGADLLKMEAMKMENRITAPRAGRIATLHTKAGDSVGQGQLLVQIE